MNPTRLGFFGMSHLGLVYSTVFANQGHEVSCYDNSAVLISRLQKGLLPINEPMLAELVMSNTYRLHYSCRIEDFSHCDLAFLSLDVATDSGGVSNLQEVIELLAQIDSALPPHVPLVILSQIPMGFCAEQSKSRSRNIIYQVETLVFGNAVDRANMPERIIVGTTSKNNELPTIYQSILDKFNCPLFIMSYESAELCKMAINFLLASNVTSTNFLSAICEMVGANWNQIVPALRSDRRIGEFAYLTPGLGISGGNLERDVSALRKVASKNKSSYANFAKVIQKMSQQQKNWPQRHFEQYLDYSRVDSLKIGIWGMSYKENTDSIKNSPSIEFIRSLPDNVSVIAFDPLVKSIPVTDKDLQFSEDQFKMLDALDALFILTPWDHFRRRLSDVLRYFNGTLIVDPFALIDMDIVVPPSIKLVVLGNAEVLS